MRVPSSARRRLEERHSWRPLGQASFQAPAPDRRRRKSRVGTPSPRSPLPDQRLESRHFGKEHGARETRRFTCNMDTSQFQRSPPPPGHRHDPARNWAGIVHQRRPPRCRCRTTRRGDPCGRPPPNGATVRWPLPGHYRTGRVERRLSRGTMRPRRAPTRPLRSSGIGSFKEGRKCCGRGVRVRRLVAGRRPGRSVPRRSPLPPGRSARMRPSAERWDA